MHPLIGSPADVVEPAGLEAAVPARFVQGDLF
jgi:hypothetical protein